ncbi:MAG: MBL fold metallo-hydrolase [Acidobacteriota bacterium]
MQVRRSRLVLPLLVAGLASWAGSRAAAQSPEGAAPAGHFQVQKLADGVYAAIRTETPGFAVDANVVFIINDADVVVVDANDTPASSREVLAALRKLTPKPVRYVVNTHWHDDHILGNQVYRDAFPGVEFVAHTATGEYLPTQGVAARNTMKENATNFGAMLREMLAKNRTGSGRELNDEDRAAFRSDLELVDRYIAEAPGVQIVLPTITIDQRLTLHRGRRTIDIRHLGRGHTAGDIVVHLPEEGILITGDLVVWPIPLVGSDQSHVSEWSATLGKLRALHAKTIVPGHGPVMRDDSYLALMEDLFASVTRQTRAAVTRSETLEKAQASVQLEEFRKKFAGDSKLRSSVFANYVAGPAVAAAYAEASPAPVPTKAAS